MGQQDIHTVADESDIRDFTQAILKDLRALETMLEKGLFETGIQRIGVEQEMALVDAQGLPAPASMELLANIDDPRFTTELALFNLEANLPPQIFRGSFLEHMEKELDDIIGHVDHVARPLGARALLTGILPTLRQSDLSLDYITPKARYRQLNDALTSLGEGNFHIFIRGVDELELQPDNVMFEAANTSFQLHLQVTPEEFAPQYNLAQLISAPLLAAAVNSPLVMGKRLWHETRVALFERSVDARSQAARNRGRLPRVNFGTDWVQNSVLELFQDAAARFPVALTCPTGPDPLAELAQGRPPKLVALLLHSGTVWRWNRACYGTADGIAHLRIENRVLPAGPTVLDEVANAALFYGLMVGLADIAADIPDQLSFDDARGNLVNAARQGLGAEITWLGGQREPVRDLLLHRLLPIARQGLAAVEVPEQDIQRYLGTLEERVQSSVTGARWMIEGFAHLETRMPSKEAASASLAQSMLQHQRSGEPVHTWPLPDLPQGGETPVIAGTVSDVMSRDLFTVRPGDVIDLATHLMHWKHFRHVPVEATDGTLRGLISHTTLLRLDKQRGKTDDALAVEDLMDAKPLTVSPSTPFEHALRLLLDSDQGCLLVVDKQHLVGIATERDFLQAAAAMLRLGTSQTS